MFGFQYDETKKSRYALAKVIIAMNKNLFAVWQRYDAEQGDGCFPLSENVDTGLPSVMLGTSALELWKIAM